MIKLFLVLCGVTFYVTDVTKADTTLLQWTVENLVNYTALEALDQLDLNAIGGAIVDAAYLNYSKQGSHVHKIKYSQLAILYAYYYGH